MALPGVTQAREDARAQDEAARLAFRAFANEVASAPESPDEEALDGLLRLGYEARVQRTLAKRAWDEVAFMEET